jgi:hypothetical protein
MAIFIILFFFRIDPLRRSVWLGVKQVRLPDGYPFVGHVAIFFGLNTALTSDLFNSGQELGDLQPLSF